MPDKTTLEAVKKKFIELFEKDPVIVEAPGRINLIGEHTDYNDGYVLPAAIDRKVTFGISSNDCNEFRFFALDLNSYYTTSVIQPAKSKFQWANYLLGVLAQFEKENIDLSGIDCVFSSTIPIGAGLSSSAAIECGFAYGINYMLDTKFNDFQIVSMAQKAEHEYAGVMCGIMDQYASVFGRQNSVFRLDCRSLEHNYYPFNMSEYAIVLCDTLVKHELASSEYNLRRQECEKGVEILKKIDPSITALRDVEIDMLKNYEELFDPITYKRCAYVVHENQRVLTACDALANEDFILFGNLMYNSHEGLMNDYEVSCNELDILVDLTKNLDYVLGSRMMGGGFGGCTINLIKRSFLNEFKDIITSGYHKQTGKKTIIYPVTLGNGVNIL